VDRLQLGSGMPLPPGGLGFGDVAVLADLVLALRSLDTAGGRSSRASRRPVAAYDSVAPCSLPSVGTSAGESDEGQRDVVMTASLDRCLP
jgi:hypothetical protein